jgi:hypothetical protein
LSCKIKTLVKQVGANDKHFNAEVSKGENSVTTLETTPRIILNENLNADQA